MGATILATLVANAVDMRGTFASTMLARLFGVQESVQGPCPVNMVLVTQALTPFCIDMYENSPSTECVHKGVSSAAETAMNLADRSCKPSTIPNMRPWTYISQLEAEQACSRAGKRLPTADEWYKAALGTPDTSQGWTDESCNVARNLADGVALGGTGMRCISDAGAYDMVGNVWEWVAGAVEYGTYDDITLPDSGYVTHAGTDGVARASASARVTAYGDDYVWVDRAIVAGIMRGGAFGNTGRAGIFALYAASPPTHTGDAVGFRCAVTPVGYD